MEIRDQEITQAQALLKSRATEIEQLSKENTAWYKSPFMYVVVGVAGVILGVAITKR